MRRVVDLDCVLALLGSEKHDRRHHKRHEGERDLQAMTVVSSCLGAGALLSGSRAYDIGSRWERVDESTSKMFAKQKANRRSFQPENVPASLTAHSQRTSTSVT
jgi:hypothetical protein